MLTAAQIIPFLVHEDAEIRATVRDYLIQSSDPSPATADDLWAAIDTLGPERAEPFLDRVGLLRQTDASLRRLLDELPKADDATRESLRAALERLDFDLLKRHWDALRKVPETEGALRDHLQARLDLENEPADAAWDRMIHFARGLKDDIVSPAEEMETERLIEAAARHKDVLRERVLTALSDASIVDWPELFVTDLAGQMKLAEAVGPLLDKLGNEESDLLWQVAGDALSRIGDETVVRQIAERFSQGSHGFKISAAEVLGRIKHPASQRVLTELLTSETDLGIVSNLALGLVDLVPDDEPTFATLRAIVRSDGYDRTIVHLDESVLMLATMTGLALPEAGEWRERIERDRSRWAMGMSNVDHLFQPGRGIGPSELHAAPLTPPGRSARGVLTAANAQPATRQPVRNAAPKIGRNDPCPCGSGKKHKKCCGR